MKTLAALILIAGLSVSAGRAQTSLNDLGQMYPEVQKYGDSRRMSLSFMSGEWPEPEQWRIAGRAKMLELLRYTPEPVTLDPEVMETVKKDGYTRYKVRYSLTPFRKTEAYLLIPDNLAGPAPAVIALHDHGGFYYYGKEKIVDTEDQPTILQDFIRGAYGGRTYADELARHGFVVLCPDAFYFGSQKLDLKSMPDYFTKDYPDLGSADINKSAGSFNRFANRYEEIMARYLFGSGATWPGILFHGDRKAVDYLLTRPEVDPQRIGCIGLSIGGFRSAHLFGLDPRISVCVDAGWMTSYSRQLENHFRHHTWMIYVPGQLDYLDLPDVVTLSAPKPLLVIDCKRDALYTVDAMQSAIDKITAVYGKMNASGRFESRWYDVPHSFNVEMQDDAIRWLEHWLKDF